MCVNYIFLFINFNNHNVKLFLSSIHVLPGYIGEKRFETFLVAIYRHLYLFSSFLFEGYFLRTLFLHVLRAIIMAAENYFKRDNYFKLFAYARSYLRTENARIVEALIVTRL